MAGSQLVTPTGIDATVVDTNISVAFDYATGGEVSANVQFVKKGDPTTVLTPTGNPFAATGTKSPYTVSITTLPTGLTTANLDDFQAQVQIVDTADPTNNSGWGLQIFFKSIITAVVSVGGVDVVLGQTALPHIFELSSPVTITYADLVVFAKNLPGSPKLPTNWPTPGNPPITGALVVQAFKVDTETKLFDVNVVANLDWTIIPNPTGEGSPILEAKSVGIEVMRTNNAKY